jgi:hypothetical protein
MSSALLASTLCSMVHGVFTNVVMIWLARTICLELSLCV